MNKTRTQIAEERGIEKGVEQGDLRALRAAVEESFEARFGGVSADLADRMAGIEDPATLRQLLRAVVVAQDAAAARAAFGASP